MEKYANNLLRFKFIIFKSKCFCLYSHSCKIYWLIIIWHDFFFCQGCYDAGVDFVEENSDILIGLGITFALLMVSV